MTSFVGLRVLYDALLLCEHLNGSVQTQLDTPPVALVAVSPTWGGVGSIVCVRHRIHVAIDIIYLEAPAQHVEGENTYLGDNETLTGLITPDRNWIRTT